MPSVWAAFPGLRLYGPQRLPELRHLYDHHPDLWREMLALQALPNKATEKFNRELRFSDYDILFHNEDAQLCWFTQ